MSAELRALYGEYLASRITATADQFRAIASRLDNLATEVPLLDPGVRPGSAANLAQRAVSEVVWGVANAKPDAIIQAAADYDRNGTPEGGAR